MEYKKLFIANKIFKMFSKVRLCSEPNLWSDGVAESKKEEPSSTNRTNREDGKGKWG